MVAQWLRKRRSVVMKSGVPTSGCPYRLARLCIGERLTRIVTHAYPQWTNVVTGNRHSIIVWLVVVSTQRDDE